MDTSSPSSDPFHGLNPADLMAAAAMPTDGGADTLPLSQLDLPSLAEIAAAFPDLEVLDLIGHGGMSAVFRARQPQLDRVIALKVLPKSLAATPGFAERFTREGRVLARLSHPNIVTVHDFGESGGFCYLIMEYVDGVNLRQAMRAGRFTPEQALNIIPAMCEALQFAHSQGVLHRDIKPENILLDAKGRVKIADFGIAKILDEKDGDSMMLTQSGARLGTAPYMAPEQIEQPGSVDHRADIYSLGVVFYEMLTGELPLGRFAAPSEKSDVNGNMDEVVFRALAKDRALRQQSAGEFKTQIEGIASMPPQMRRSLAMGFSSFEYKTKRMLLGMPLLSVTSGIDPTTGRKRTARGFFAFGDRAVGVFAFGGYARGVFACGGMAVGVFALGGMSIGLISWGGFALALLLAYGGLSVGFLSAGGLALGWEAAGGIAAGVHAYGGQVYALVGGMGGDVHAPQVVKHLAQLPELLQWLVRVTNQSGLLMSWIWLPAMLPSVIMPWWARRQLEFEAQGGGERATFWYERPSRVLWLLPDLILFFLGLVLMSSHWFHPGQSGTTAQIFIASAIEFVGLVLSAVSLPLWLRLVPMNSFYGVRLPATFISDERWYDVNATFGRHLFGWSFSVIAAGIAGFYQLPRHQESYSWAAVTLILMAVAASVVAALGWMRQHPPGSPARKKNRLMSCGGQVVVAVVIAMFIKSFIAAPYRIAGGAETGVTKGSHWLVSRLDTGFESGELIIYLHESDQYWIARVIAVEAKGLRLKRGGSAEEFFMPWDRIAGKMLFSYLSPDALEQKPVLLFTRLKRDGQDWQWPLYTPEGIPVLDDESKRLVMGAASSDVNGLGSMNGLGSHDCWLQLWVQNPNFDRHTSFKVEINDLNGLPLRDRDTTINGPSRHTSNPDAPLLCFVLSPGLIGRLPSEVQIKLWYDTGPWQSGVVLPVTFSGAVLLGENCMLTGVGDDPGSHAFVSWSMNSDELSYDVEARLKDGKTGRYFEISRGGSGKHITRRARFLMPLHEVESFQFRGRKLRSVTFPHVMIPPLP